MFLTNLLLQIIIIFILMLVGVFLKKIGFLRDTTNTDLTKIILYFISPCVIIKAFEQKFSADRMITFLITSIGVFSIYIISIIISKLIFSKVKDKNLQRTLKYGSVYPNSGFMGIPLAQALFGSQGVFFSVISVLAFNIFSWSHGVSLFNEQKGWKELSRDILMNPNIIAILLGIFVFVFSIPIPNVVNQLLDYIAAMFAPLSMIIIGCSLADIQLKALSFNRLLILAILLKNFIYPIFSIFILIALGVTGTSLLTTVILTSCPVAGLVVLFTVESKGDAEPGILLVSLSTILSLITIPFIIFFLNFLHLNA